MYTLDDIRMESKRLAIKEAENGKWQRELDRRKRSIRMHPDDWYHPIVGQYNCTYPTGCFNHKVFLRDRNIEGVRGAGLYGNFKNHPGPITLPIPIAVEMSPFKDKPVYGNNLYYQVYEIIFDESIKRGSVIKMIDGDYDFSYPQFVDRVYYEYAKEKE